MSDVSTADGRRPRRPHRRVLTFAVLTVALLVAIAGGWIIHLDDQLDDVPRFDAGLSRRDRPPRVPGPAENILLAGVDDGQGVDLLKALEPGRWRPGVFRSDAIMVLHVDPEKDLAQLVSIPRDSMSPSTVWVPRRSTPHSPQADPACS